MSVEAGLWVGREECCAAALAGYCWVACAAENGEPRFVRVGTVAVGSVAAEDAVIFFALRQPGCTAQSLD